MKKRLVRHRWENTPETRNWHNVLYCGHCGMRRTNSEWQRPGEPWQRSRLLPTCASERSEVSK